MPIYFIPRNYSDNGRLLGLFEGRHVVQAVAVALPFTLLAAYLPWLPLLLRAILWGALAIFPALLCLSGMADRLWLILTFRREARRYLR